MSDFFDDIGSHDAAWLAGDGPDADVVVATKARLARNLMAFPFPHRASEIDLAAIHGDLGRRLAVQSLFADGWTLDSDKFDHAQRLALREMMLAGAWPLSAAPHRSLTMSADRSLAAMVNEEDHLRICAWRSGLAPASALAGVLELDECLDGAYEAAFSDDLGYLTAYPADVGTGLRLTAILHLPGLVMADEIEKVLNALRHLQFSVCGLGGPGSVVRGAMFRVGNLSALGRDEAETSEDFAVHVGKIVSYERSARDLLLSRDRRGIEDLAGRALGVLGQSRLITSQETWECLSHVRLGVGLNLIPERPWGTLNRLLIRQQGGHLDLRAGRRLGSRERAAARADYLREYFSPR